MHPPPPPPYPPSMSQHVLTPSHLHFIGPGLVSSVAYIDPGNWATDLQAGAGYGYKLLFVVLVAGLAAVGKPLSLTSNALSVASILGS